MSRLRDGGWVLPASLCVALLLGLLPLPDTLQPLRPFWLALVLAYWVIEAPDSVGLGFAVIVGLIADLMFGTLLGEQALRLVIMAFILQRFRARLRFFPLWQQALAVFALLLNDRLVALAIRLAAGDGAPPWGTWLSPVAGFALWPWLFLLLDELRLRLRERNP
jgi:rod shape-determining protein MreD